MAESRSLSNETVRLTRRMFATGGAPLIGSAQDIADQIEALSEKGVDGILSAWFDFEDGLPRLIDEVFPKLEQRGLRKAFAPVEPAGS
jgi:alkanesulfonate monooxygenase SsuD/methylene tetrahydromethanopterin reductase-like flavin-dependent oxidoreductase (luciferase family)